MKGPKEREREKKRERLHLVTNPLKPSVALFNCAARHEHLQRPSALLQFVWQNDWEASERSVCMGGK